MGAISILEGSGKRFFSDFGGLRIKESGLRIGDQIILRPFNGGKHEITLNRLSYDLKKGIKFKYLVDKSEIEIPFISKIYTQYQLKLCSELPGSKLNEDARYILRATGLNPFKLNGNYTFEAFLEYGDIVELEYSRLEVKKKITDEDSVTQKMLLNKKIIQSDLSVLIAGETGTGKSRLSKFIHEESLKMGPFVHINISSFSPTLIESELFGHVKGAFTGAINPKLGAFAEAHKGTLFIDEIDSMPLDVQTKLLLFLDNKKIRPVGAERDIQLNVRLIFSSGNDLKELVRLGKMRKDFYYRLITGGKVSLESLRENPVRITELLREFESEKGVFITPTLKKFYKQYAWPGNIRQLLGHLNQKLVLAGGGKIDFCAIDEDLENNILEENVIRCSGEIKTLEVMKTMYVKKIYEKLDNNIKRSARVLGVSPNTVRNTIRS